MSEDGEYVITMAYEDSKDEDSKDATIVWTM